MYNGIYGNGSGITTSPTSVGSNSQDAKSIDVEARQ